MSNIQQAVISALKEGQLVLIHDRRRPYLAAATHLKEAVSRAISMLPPESHQEAFVAISESTQLYNFVTPIPDLAWDIMEYAEKALHVVFSKGKGVPEEVLPEGKIRVMLVQEDPVLEILKKMPQGMLCLPIPEHMTEKVSAGVTQALAITPQTACRLTPERIMELGLQGEVNFIKK